MNNKYNEKSFGEGLGSLQSAKIIVPLMLGLYRPASVVDVGCGSGTFLSVFREHGIEDIFGFDGDWVNTDNLRIPKNLFQHRDLEKPIHFNREFGLAVSLEVAEHISEASAEIFVDSLTSLAPVVLFSAAAPYQGGLHHINEQWPEYWVKLFAQKGYEVLDPFRKKLWDNEQVGWWYRQNILLFVRKDFLKSNEELQKEHRQSTQGFLSIIHPELYRRRVEDNSIINAIKWIRTKLREIKKRRG